jgi:hypothetical protein
VTFDGSGTDLSLMKFHVSSNGASYKSISTIQCSYPPYVIHQWGKTTFVIADNVIGDGGVSNFVLLELGSLDFALRFCRSVCQLYKTHSYIPPHGDASTRNIKLTECINLAEESVKLLNEMQSERRDK